MYQTSYTTLSKPKLTFCTCKTRLFSSFTVKSAVILEVVTFCQVLAVPCRIVIVTIPSSHTDTIWMAPSQSQAFREAPLGLCVFLLTIYTRTCRNYTPLLGPLIMYLTGDCSLNIPKYCNSQSIGNIDPNCSGGPKQIQKENECKMNQQWQHFQYYSHFSHTLLWALQK